MQGAGLEEYDLFMILCAGDSYMWKTRGESGKGRVSKRILYGDAVSNHQEVWLGEKECKETKTEVDLVRHAGCIGEACEACMSWNKKRGRRHGACMRSPNPGVDRFGPLPVLQPGRRHVKGTRKQTQV
jgi:hypothetical protein